MGKREDDEAEMDRFWSSLTADQQATIRRKQEAADELGIELVIVDVEDLRQLLK